MPISRGKRREGRLLVAGLVLLASAACQARRAPGPRAFEACRAHAQRPARKDQVTARFLGTTSILFQDGDTSVLTDGFVTRPRLARVVLGRVAPEDARIRHAMHCLGVDTVTAVVALHSHYDHALDAPRFAQLAHAVLVGSPSTANLGYGARLPIGRIRVVRDGDTIHVGKFMLTFIESAHNPKDRFPGTIDRPLTPPARVKRWRTGTAWSLLVAHGGRSILVQGSAGYRPGALRGRRADVVYLAIGGLADQSEEFIEAYWQEVVVATDARRVVLVHWDDFFRGLEEPLRPMPHRRDDVGAAIRQIMRRAARDTVEVVSPLLWRPSDPFARD